MIRPLRFATGILLIVFLAWRWTNATSTPERIKPRVATSTTRAIEQIRVGQRVLTQREPSVRTEPYWRSWIHVTAVMPMTASGPEQTDELLTVELLRPETWVSQRLHFDSHSPGKRLPRLLPIQPSYAPMRAIYLDMVEQLDEFDENQPAPALLIDLDLPELGAVGSAWVIDIDGHVEVTEGPGHVVTATFKHPATCQLFEVAFAGDGPTTSQESITVTENHPFWNADRNEFTPIGRMSIGERVLTNSGDCKRIVSKLARPGPQVVYNLEVHGEHVYCVGKSGLLVHNNCLSDDSWENTPRDRATITGHEARENGLNPVPNRSALMSGRELSISEDHHIASPYRKPLARLFKSLGLNIRTHPDNLINLDFHTGPHLPIYHKFVLRVLTKSIAGKEGAAKLTSFNETLIMLGKFLQRHPAIPNHFQL